MIKTARCMCPAHTPAGRAGAHRALNGKDPMVMVPKVWRQLSAADLLCPPAVWGHRHLGRPQPFWLRDGADTGLPRLAVSSWEGSGRGGHTAWLLSHYSAERSSGTLHPSMARRLFTWCPTAAPRSSATRPGGPSFQATQKPSAVPRWPPWGLKCCPPAMWDLPCRSPTFHLRVPKPG